MASKFRRFVLKHFTGPFAGLYQICGEQDYPFTNEELPSQILDVPVSETHIAHFNLRLASDRYILYSEENPHVAPGPLVSAIVCDDYCTFLPVEGGTPGESSPSPLPPPDDQNRPDGPALA